MPQAPASRAARTTSAICSGRSEIPGRIGAMPTPALIPASVSALTALSRWRGCAVEGSVFRQTSSSSVGIENVTETLARLAASARTSMSRTIIGPRVMIENGCRSPGELLDAAAGQPVPAFGGLVGIGGCPDGDRLALPARPSELPAQDLGDVDLDPDRDPVAVVERPVGALLEGADVTERAAVDAAHVGVQRPVEPHALDPVQGAPAGLFPVFDSHSSIIEHTFVPATTEPMPILKEIAVGRRPPA